MAHISGPPQSNLFLVGVNTRDLARSLSTRTVKFMVGRDRAEYHLHLGLVASLSDPLHALVSRQSSISMPDVDTETFTYFTQFVYSGWYSYEKFDAQLSESVQSYNTEFLSHAKLWVFANTYHIWPLKNLAHTNLARTLESWEISPVTFIADFGRMVRYAYGLRFGEELRGLICWFAARIAEDVYHLEGWQCLLEEIAGFPLGLIEAMENQLA